MWQSEEREVDEEIKTGQISSPQNAEDFINDHLRYPSWHPDNSSGIHSCPPEAKKLYQLFNGIVDFNYLSTPCFIVQYIVQ